MKRYYYIISIIFFIFILAWWHLHLTSGFSPKEWSFFFDTISQFIPHSVKQISEFYRITSRIGPDIVNACIETVEISFIGTVLSLPIAFLLALLGAGTIAPKGWNLCARSIMAFLRTIPIIVFALIFVVLLGLGPAPGVLAITVHSIGIVGKLVVEAIEDIDIKQRESLLGIGCTKIQIFRWVILPNVGPMLLSIILIRFESNIRSAAILGIVGAGGIGYYLHIYIRSFQYLHAVFVITILLLIVFGTEFVTGWIRRKILKTDFEVK